MNGKNQPRPYVNIYFSFAQKVCVPSQWCARLDGVVKTITPMARVALCLSTSGRRGPGITIGEVRLRTDQGHVRESNLLCNHCYLPNKCENDKRLPPNLSQCIGIVEVSFAEGDDFMNIPTR